MSLYAVRCWIRTLALFGFLSFAAMNATGALAAPPATPQAPPQSGCVVLQRNQYGYFYEFKKDQAYIDERPWSGPHTINVSLNAFLAHEDSRPIPTAGTVYTCANADAANSFADTRADQLHQAGKSVAIIYTHGGARTLYNN